MTVQTLGDQPDTDGYLVRVDGTERGSLDQAGELVVASLSGGRHTVELTEIATNCRVTNSSNPGTVSVVAGATVDYPLLVFCLAEPVGRIFFVRGGSIYSMTGIGGDERPLGANGFRLGVSADGRWITFNSPDDDIWVASSNGSGLRNVTQTPGVQEIDPDLSPDGRRLAYAMAPDPANTQGPKDIFVANRDGSNPINLTNTPETGDVDPDWSPDGTQIAFRSAGDLFIMNADGSGVRALNTGTFSTDPQWSPDGRWIAYVTPGPPDVWIIGADGSGRMRLTNDGQSSVPTWSPDGRWIAFAGRRGSAFFRVHVMRPDGSDVVPLTIDRSDEPAWAP